MKIPARRTLSASAGRLLSSLSLLKSSKSQDLVSTGLCVGR